MKIPFQAFEGVNMEMTPQVKEPQSIELSMASWKDMKVVIQTGHPKGWGRVLELPVNKDRYVLGFHSYQQIEKNVTISAVKRHIPSLPDTFTNT